MCNNCSSSVRNLSLCNSTDLSTSLYISTASGYYRYVFKVKMRFLYFLCVLCLKINIMNLVSTSKWQVLMILVDREPKEVFAIGMYGNICFPFFVNKYNQ